MLTLQPNTVCKRLHQNELTTQKNTNWVLWIGYHVNKIIFKKNPKNSYKNYNLYVIKVYKTPKFFYITVRWDLLDIWGEKIFRPEGASHWINNLAIVLSFIRKTLSTRAGINTTNVRRDSEQERALIFMWSQCNGALRSAPLVERWTGYKWVPRNQISM